MYLSYQVVFTDNEGRAPITLLNPLHLIVYSYNSTNKTVEEDRHISIPSNGFVELNINTPNKTHVHKLEIQVDLDLDYNCMI